MFNAVGLQIEGKAIARSLHDTMWPANEGDIHALIMDQLTDTAFGVADKDFSPAGVGNGKDTPWPAYRTWYETRGEKGMEPPELIKETIKWREQLATSPDPKARDEAAQKLLEMQAENLWYIGTVAMAPHPVMVANRLKNVPEKGIWDWRSTYMHAYWPSQFYLEQ
jgi:peptide/nickel transport system substrate-binding protein